MRGVLELGGYWLDNREPGRPGWYAYWYERGRRKVRRRKIGQQHLDVEAAKLAFSEWVLANQRPNLAASDKVRLAVLLERYRVEWADHLPSADTTLYAIQNVLRFFRGDLVGEVTTLRQREFIRSLGKRGQSPGYIGRQMRVLSAAVNYGLRERMIADAPRIITAKSEIERLVGIAMPDDGTMRRLSLDELGALLNGIKADHVWRYCLLTLNTLARPAAILELQQDQIDLEAGLINLNPSKRPQTKKRRPIVPITDSLMPWLRLWCQEKEDGKGRALPANIVHYKRRPVTKVNKALREAAIDAGLMEAGKQDDVTQNVTPYTLRRTMARELRRNGVPIEAISGILGHTMPGYEMTFTYADSAPEVLLKAKEGIDDILGQLQAKTRKNLLPAPTVHPQTKKQGARQTG